MKGALTVVAGDLGISMPALLTEAAILIYGTARATNAVVTKRSARTAVLTTRGFQDTPILKEAGHRGPHGYSTDYPDLYISHPYLFEIGARVSAKGEVLISFDEAQARAVIEALKARKTEAAAVFRRSLHGAAWPRRASNSSSTRNAACRFGNGTRGCR